MLKSIFEQLGGAYHEETGILYQTWHYPPKKDEPIGLFGQWHLELLKECHKGTYINLLTSGRLNTYLADIDRQAQ